MKYNDKQPERECPNCGKVYRNVPALSRKDNTTLICPDCGIREALESLGMTPAERENVLGIIKASGRA